MLFPHVACKIKGHRAQSDNGRGGNYYSVYIENLYSKKTYSEVLILPAIWSGTKKYSALCASGVRKESMQNSSMSETTKQLRRFSALLGEGRERDALVVSSDSFENFEARKSRQRGEDVWQGGDTELSSHGFILALQRFRPCTEAVFGDARCFCVKVLQVCCSACSEAILHGSEQSIGDFYMQTLA